MSTAPAANTGCTPVWEPPSTKANPRHSTTAATTAAFGPSGSRRALRARTVTTTNTARCTAMSTVPYRSPSNWGTLANAVVAW